MSGSREQQVQGFQGRTSLALLRGRVGPQLPSKRWSSPLHGWETEARRHGLKPGQSRVSHCWPPACLARGGLPGRAPSLPLSSPHPLGSAWSMMVRGMAAQMRPAWAASWRPWCRLPSTASTGPVAASWSSAATSRRSPPPLGPGWGSTRPAASSPPSHLPSPCALPHTMLL